MPSNESYCGKVDSRDAVKIFDQCSVQTLDMWQWPSQEEELFLSHLFIVKVSVVSPAGQAKAKFLAGTREGCWEGTERTQRRQSFSYVSFYIYISLFSILSLDFGSFPKTLS